MSNSQALEHPHETHAGELSPVHILRDQAQLFDRIRRADDLDGLIRQSLLTAIIGAAVFGAALGTYAQTPSQMAASTLKLPILLLGATLICFPAFHVLQSWRARAPLALRAGVALQSVSLASVALIWGSLSPAVLFLVTSTQHYRLCQFLAVGVGAAGGVVGLSVLSAGYAALCESAASGEPAAGKSADGAPIVTMSENRGRLRRLLTKDRPLAAYLFLYSCVGGQLAWMLRPFIGSPTMPFQVFRAADPEAGNFFLMLLRMLGMAS